MNRIKLLYILFGIFLLSSCIPASPLPTLAATEPQATPLPTATDDAPIPAGWVTHTNDQQCRYTISYPADMQVTDQGPYSQTFGVRLEDLEMGARNFIYVSVIPPEIQDRVKQGTYSSGEVYNYDSAATDILLKLPVGGSGSLHQNLEMASGFTYQRLPDATVGDRAAQAYENVQPWEFPAGTKESRYYVFRDGCTFLIGGYMDTTGSDQPGTISEDLFHQIVASIGFMP